MLQVGVDCEKISRFRKLPYRKNKRFYQKIFTPQEIKYCIGYRDPYPRFAVRFAAKEAAIKALNGIASPPYSDIEVKKDKNNKPRICIDKNRFRAMVNLSMALSLTHSDSYAVAFTVITDNTHRIKEKARVIAGKSASCIRKTIGR